MSGISLAELMEKGGFVSPDLIKKTVTWAGAKGGTTDFDIYIKPPSAATVDRGARALRATGDNNEESLAPRPLLISATVFFDPEGKQGITYAKACELKEDLCRVLYEAVTNVVNDGAEDAKNSVPATSSGLSLSPAASVDAQ
jgi:hypothetical protein